MIMAPAPTAHFDTIIAAINAKAVPREVWPGAKPNACHENCEAFVACFQVVRGWLVTSDWSRQHQKLGLPPH